MKTEDLLATLLGSKSASQNLFMTLGSLERIFTSSRKELLDITGIGSFRAAQIEALSELFKSYTLEKSRELKEIQSPSDVYKLVMDLEEEVQEKLVVILKNARGKLIHKTVVAQGTLDHLFVHPRDVFRQALAYAAHSLILVHNHPSGDVDPSKEDLRLTQQLMKAGQMLGIEVTDHLIIGKGSYLSFWQEGFLFPSRKKY